MYGCLEMLGEFQEIAKFQGVFLPKHSIEMQIKLGR